MFRLPGGGKRLAFWNLGSIHLPLRSIKLELVKWKVVLGSQPQPHIGLNRILGELLQALHVALAEQQLRILVSLLGGKPHPHQPSRDVFAGQEVNSAEKELRVSVALIAGRL